MRARAADKSRQAAAVSSERIATEEMIVGENQAARDFIQTGRALENLSSLCLSQAARRSRMGRGRARRCSRNARPVPCASASAARRIASRPPVAGRETKPADLRRVLRDAGKNRARSGIFLRRRRIPSLRQERRFRLLMARCWRRERRPRKTAVRRSALQAETSRPSLPSQARSGA